MSYSDAQARASEEREKRSFGGVVSRSGIIKITTPRIEDIDKLLLVEAAAWGTTDGESLEASREKIVRRIQSFPEGITLATIWGPEGIYEDSDPVGSQYAFRCEWDGDPASLSSWDAHTANGWTDTIHRPMGNTGFLVGGRRGADVQAGDFLSHPSCAYDILGRTKMGETHADFRIADRRDP